MCHIPISSTLSYQEPELPARPEGSIQIPSPSDLSHSFLVRQAASCTLESSMSLLTRSLASYLEFCQQHAQNLDSLAGIYQMKTDNLPSIFTDEELYSNMVDLKFKIKTESQTVSHLEILLDYARKVMETAIETAFLVGIDETAIRNSEQLLRINESIAATKDRLSYLKHELRSAEIQHIKQTGESLKTGSVNNDPDKEINQPSNESAINKSITDSSDLQSSSEKMSELLAGLSKFESQIYDENIKISAKSEAEQSEKSSESGEFKFEDYSDGETKFSIKEEDKSGEDEFDKNEDSSDDSNVITEDKEDDKEKKEDFTYKFPTF